MPRVFLTRQANVDLQEIWTYLAQDNVDAADKLIHEFHEAFQLLVDQPDLGVPQFQYRKGLRCKVIRKRYLIFYEPAVGNLRVLRVLHSARDWSYLF
jgi:toxin ParE1/3/4